jgi:hypothetical protein
MPLLFRMSANDGSFLTHKLNERIMELNGDLGKTPPGWKRNNIMAEIKRIREKELPPAFAALKAAKIP